MTATTGSPFWQMVIVMVAVLFLLWEIWRGWRNGVIRSGLKVVAVVASSVLGLAAAHLAAAPFGGFEQSGGFMFGCMVGAGVGLAVFLAIWLCSAVLFKRTEHQKSGIFKLFWGLGGAFFGGLMGIIILWGGISAIRALGAMAEAGSRPPSGRLSPYGMPTPKPATAKMADGLITLRDSLELGPLGHVVESVDPIPTDAYQLIEEIGQLSRDQSAMVRFIEYPDIQRFIQTPRLVDILGDPDVVRASQEGNIAALISNKKLIAAVEDPALAAELKKIDLRAALKFALEKPTPTPAPSPQPTLPPAPPKPTPAKKK